MAADLHFSLTTGGSIVVSSALIGASVGSLGAGQVADAIGPGRALVWNNLTLLVGSLLCAVSPGGMWAAVLGAAPSSSTVQEVSKVLWLHQSGRRR